MVTEYRAVTGDEVADSIDRLERATRTLAPDASARLQLAAANVRRVSPEATYTWVDPASFAHEVETNASRRAETLNAIRNVLILIPLTLTWLALALAAVEYAVDIQHYHDDIYQPFLALWQNQFPHAGWPITFTLSDVGMFDFILLIVILALTWGAQVIERDARLTAQRLTRDLTAITPKLVALSGARGGKPLVGPDASVQDVADAIQGVIDQAMDQTRQLTTAAEQRLTEVAESAQRSIVSSRDAVSQLLAGHVAPMIDRFSNHLTALQTQLEEYQAKLDTLATASQKIADVADALGTNAGTYMTAATQMTHHIDELRTTQGELVNRIDMVGAELRRSSDALGVVAESIGAEMVSQIRDTGQYLNETNVALHQTTLGLQHATHGLDTAAERLSEQSRRGVRRGILDILFARGSSRRAASY